MHPIMLNVMILHILEARIYVLITPPNLISGPHRHLISSGDIAEALAAVTVLGVSLRVFKECRPV